MTALWRKALWLSDAPKHVKSVGACMAEYANKKSEVWPSAPLLSHGRGRDGQRRPHTGLSEGTIRGARGWLVDNGWLTPVSNWSGSTPRYRLNFPPGSFEEVSGLPLRAVEGDPPPVKGTLRQLEGGLGQVEGGLPPNDGEVDFEVEYEESQELQSEIEPLSQPDLATRTRSSAETDDERRARAAQLREVPKRWGK
jgi:hypothetical protein